MYVFVEMHGISMFSVGIRCILLTASIKGLVLTYFLLGIDVKLRCSLFAHRFMHKCRNDFECMLSL